MNQFTPSSDVIDLIDTFKTKQRILILKWIYTVKKFRKKNRNKI